jgi:hypothetical protein
MDLRQTTQQTTRDSAARARDAVRPVVAQQRQRIRSFAVAEAIEGPALGLLDAAESLGMGPYRVVLTEDGEISLWFRHRARRAETDSVGEGLIVVMLEHNPDGPAQISELPARTASYKRAMGTVRTFLRWDISAAEGLRLASR